MNSKRAGKDAYCPSQYPSPFKRHNRDSLLPCPPTVPRLLLFANVPANRLETQRVRRNQRPLGRAGAPCDGNRGGGNDSGKFGWLWRSRRKGHRPELDGRRGCQSSRRGSSHAVLFLAACVVLLSLYLGQMTEKGTPRGSSGTKRGAGRIGLLRRSSLFAAEISQVLHFSWWHRPLVRAAQCCSCARLIPTLLVHWFPRPRLTRLTQLFDACSWFF